MNPHETPNQESGPQIPTDKELISLFKEHGETPESLEKYSLWFAQKQKEADESTSEYSRLKFNIDVAEVLVESCMMDDACQYCDGAWDIIDNEVSRIGEENIPFNLKELIEDLNKVCDKIK